VKYRFPLDKLALLENRARPTPLRQDRADIKNYFGLIPDNASSGYYRKWIYTNPAAARSPPPS